MSEETRQPDDNAQKRRTIDKLHLVNFTAFKDLEIEFSPGINAIIGENATGKTHMMKVMYYLSMTGGKLRGLNPDIQLSSYFFSTYRDQWSLIHRDSNPPNSTIQIASGKNTLHYEIHDEGKLMIDNGEGSGRRTSAGTTGWLESELSCCFIPAKEIISHNKYFISTYDKREIYFERQYRDILSNAGLGELKELPPLSGHILCRIENVIGGPVDEYSDVYHIDQHGFKLELSLVAEGLRKFALLWLLVRNGSIAPGSILFWDEPEANLNPKLIRETVQIILLMQRMGVQVFFATHDFVMLKWLDLLTEENDKVRYHALYRDDTAEIQCESKDTLTEIENNAILDVYTELYDKDLDRAMQRLKHGEG